MGKFNFIFHYYCVAIFCFSCSTQTEAQQNTNQNFSNSQPQTNIINSDVKNEVDTSKWKTYTDAKNGFSFQYPPDLILRKNGGNVRLYHFIKYRYQDPCDMSSENPPTLDRLIDFDVAFAVVKKDFAKVLKANENLEETPFDIPQLSGKIEGKSVRHTFEFCGYYEYFYPLRENETLIIKDQIAGYLYEMAYSEAKKTDAWKNPNVIKPEMQATILAKILESFKVSQKKNNSERQNKQLWWK
jgi:hypothetical protein